MGGRGAGWVSTLTSSQQICYFRAFWISEELLSRWCGISVYGPQAYVDITFRQSLDCFLSPLGRWARTSLYFVLVGPCPSEHKSSSGASMKSFHARAILGLGSPGPGTHLAANSLRSFTSSRFAMSKSEGITRNKNNLDLSRHLENDPFPLHWDKSFL